MNFTSTTSFIGKIIEGEDGISHPIANIYFWKMFYLFFCFFFLPFKGLAHIFYISNKLRMF